MPTALLASRDSRPADRNHGTGRRAAVLAGGRTADQRPPARLGLFPERISAFARPTAPRSTPFTLWRLHVGGATTARPGCGQTITQTTTAPSCWIPTAIGSRRFVMRRPARPSSRAASPYEQNIDRVRDWTLVFLPGASRGGSVARRAHPLEGELAPRKWLSVVGDRACQPAL
jgi:hypothetical protein